MKDEGRSPIKLNVGVGIIGSASYAISVGENSKSTHIQRHGSMVPNVIPSVIVVCEDALAKTAIEMATKGVNGSFKIITAGAWDNMPTLLYGIYFYREQLRASGDQRHLEVVCVMDGDIRDKDFNEGILKTHRGNHVPDDVRRTLALIKENLVNFQLTELRPFKGLPEYNHQVWLDEISAETIDNHHEAELSMLESALHSAEEKHEPSIKILILELKAEISEAKRVIACSKQLLYYTLKDDNDKIDCHYFYDELKKKLMEGDTLRKYPLHTIEYNVLSIISMYNPKRWQAYITPVKEAMQEAFYRHVKIFKPDRFNLTEIEGD
jgi:hypothetical protein